MKEKPLTHALASSATWHHDHMSCHSYKHKVNEHEGHMYNQNSAKDWQVASSRPVCTGNEQTGMT